MNITTIGLDLAKNVFQVHAVDQEENVVVRKQLRRPMVVELFAKLPPCLVGMEACGSAHHWARELKRLGHDVRLMPPQYVKPYVKRGKNDATDAEAICEAVTRPSMRFVPIKGTEQQAVLMLHRTRDLFVRQRTMLTNAFRGHLSELGIIAATGMENISKLITIVKENKDKQIPKATRTALRMIIGQLRDLKTRIDRLEKEIITCHRKNPESKRLATIPGIWAITASALSATITDTSQFSSGRQLAAGLGLFPGRTPSAAKTGLAGSQNRGIDICGNFSLLGPHRCWG